MSYSAAACVIECKSIAGLEAIDRRMWELRREYQSRRGRRATDILIRKARKQQGLACVKMNATEDVNWLDTPSVVDAAVDRLKAVKAEGLDAGIDFHGRLHRPMAKQLVKALEPHR